MPGGKLALALVLLAAPAGVSSADRAPPAGATLDQAISICRMAFAEELAGRRPIRAQALFDALPAGHKPGVAAVCSGYAIGKADLLQILQPLPAPVQPLLRGGKAI